MIKKHFAAHVLMFNCSSFILRMIDNCAPFVDKIYVAYSEVPFSYNSRSRLQISNPTDKSILNNSKYFNKIHLIEGIWEKDEDARNDCLKQAKIDGFDYLIIQDADEFYFAEDYRNNLDQINSNLDYDVYVSPWHVFWKNSNYVIEFKDKKVTEYNAGFAINCKTVKKFDRSRTVVSKKIFFLTGLCYHFAYALTDIELRCKINTWLHSVEFNRDSWFRRKWLLWHESTINLHPVNPAGWRRTIRFEGKLPLEMSDYEFPKIRLLESNLLEKIWCIFEDIKIMFIERSKSLIRK
jgi:hypothetical protein